VGEEVQEVAAEGVHAWEEEVVFHPPCHVPIRECPDRCLRAPAQPLGLVPPHVPVHLHAPVQVQVPLDLEAVFRVALAPEESPQELDQAALEVLEQEAPDPAQVPAQGDLGSQVVAPPLANSMIS